MVFLLKNQICWLMNLNLCKNLTESMLCTKTDTQYLKQNNCCNSLKTVHQKAPNNSSCWGFLYSVFSKFSLIFFLKDTFHNRAFFFLNTNLIFKGKMKYLKTTLPSSSLQQYHHQKTQNHQGFILVIDIDQAL